MKHWILGLTSIALASFAQAQEEETPQPDRDGWLMTSISIDDLEYIVETQGHELEELIPSNVAVMAMGINGVRFFNQPTCQHVPVVYGGLAEKESAKLLEDFFQAIGLRTLVSLIPNCCVWRMRLVN